MSFASRASVPRRRLTAGAVATALTLVVAAAGPTAAAAGAEAHASATGPARAATSPVRTSVPVSVPASVPASVTASVPASVPVFVPVLAPVSVPADLAFEVDVVPVTVTPDRRPLAATGVQTGSAGAASGSVREVAEATLAGLPASAGVTLLLDHPQLGGHLGGVFMGSPGYLLLNASRLAGDPDRTRDVVRHEIAHVYQARLASTRGLAQVQGRLTEVFGPGGLERSADCVALALGATWTHYTSDCAGSERAAAVEALLAGRMP